MKINFFNRKPKTLHFNFPKSWNELSIAQLEKLAILFNTKTPGTKFDIKIIFILLNYNWWEFLKKAKTRVLLYNVPLSELKTHIDFIYTKNERTKFAPFLKSKIRNLKSKIYFAPQERIANLTVEEFSVADDLHIKWRETKNIEYLQYLAAVLYTTTKKRPEFDKNQLHDKAQAFTKIPLRQLLAMEITYFGCKNHIVKRFPRTFPKPIKNAPQLKGKKYGFGKIILAMTKGDLSKLETIKKVNVYSFLEQFEEDLTNASKQKK